MYVFGNSWAFPIWDNMVYIVFFSSNFISWWLYTVSAIRIGVSIWQNAGVFSKSLFMWTKNCKSKIIKTVKSWKLIQNCSKLFDLEFLIQCGRLPGVHLIYFPPPSHPTLYTIQKSKLNVYMLCSSTGVAAVIDSGFTAYHDVAWYAVSLFFGSYLAASRPTLGHWQQVSFTH